MLPHTVFITPEASTDSYGVPTLGSTTSYTARVTFGTHLVRDGNGDTVPSSGECWLATTAIINISDKIEFERDISVSPTIFDRLFPIRIDTFSDEGGFHHVKIHFK